MSAILEGLVRHKSIPIWAANGSSVVGIVRAEGGADEYEILIMNKMPRKRVVVSLKVLEERWLAAPRIDIKWFNEGSAWVRLDEIYNVTRYNRFIIDKRQEDQVRLQVPVKGMGTGYRTERVFDLMRRCVRVWGVGEMFPEEPVPYQAKKRSTTPRKTSRTAFERILADDLLPEDL